jgi:hypothetical protein
VTLTPAPVLALILGIAHVCLYVLIRGSAGQRLPWLIGAAFLGAWAGDALASRVGIDPFRLGDFHPVSASVLAWVGIIFVAIVAVLAPPAGRPGHGTRQEPESGDVQDPESGRRDPDAQPRPGRGAGTEPLS